MSYKLYNVTMSGSLTSIKAKITEFEIKMSKPCVFFDKKGRGRLDMGQYNSIDFKYCTP